MGWDITGSLTSDQVDLLNLAGTNLGFTGTPLTSSDDSTHPIFAVLSQGCIAFIQDRANQQIDANAAAATMTDKAAAESAAGTITT